ncbi:MAG: DNA repair protein RecN [Nocardioidaceae bacterium]|nr:DNA repair protein RecN [Nocardioidaceae bacterium]
MWHEIRLRGLGVIDEAVLELGAGLSVITGETGAGKTMVVTALGLLRGLRADSGLVRHDSDRCRVEARIGIGEHPDVRRRVEDAGGEVDEGEELLVARSLSAQGRSRAFVGGVGVPAATLASVSEQLVAVHGQSDQHRLLRPAAQRAALDRFAGNAVSDLLADYRPAYERWRTVGVLLGDLITHAQERAREVERLRFGLEEVEAVSPQPREDEQLRREEDRLANAESLRAATGQAHACLSGGDEVGADAASLTARSRSLLEAERDHDPTVADLADRAAELSYQLVDLATELASYSTAVESDPVRLAAVQERRAALSGLIRRYGTDLEAVLSWSRDARKHLLELEGTDERIESLHAERDELTAVLLQRATAVGQARRRAAEQLSARVSSELTELAMPHARVVVAVRTPQTLTEQHLGPCGADEVEMLLAANAGAQERALAKGASGGELSRVMLALEVVLADSTEVPTFVFDEVDAGIGGRAAIEVGRRLARLAQRAQVIAVTHLPQVAAFADHHHRVVKTEDGAVTTSGVVRLDALQRVEELSRMLAGVQESEAAQTHAQEMLDLAARERGRLGAAWQDDDRCVCPPSAAPSRPTNPV